ncbi:MAG: methyltransferase domain-containing protein [Oceanospirillaceae bacterium]|jgi:ubiquinone/menaquinone biosynthesis C-methylase UbiE|nr:methyltransferase domain-containing protein [Oceanospirillaceae bacterium]
MEVSSKTDVSAMYDATAASYAKMMQQEITQPKYADVLGRLASRIGDVSGTVVDTSCGSGHMLAMYHAQYDASRALIGIDLSPEMVALSKQYIGNYSSAIVGDMCDLASIASDSAAAVVSFFALHHLDTEGVAAAVKEWHRVLTRGGQLVIATWEGEGEIDYGSSVDIVALRYTLDDLVALIEAVGFNVSRAEVEAVDDMFMEAIYIEAEKA